MSNKRIVQKLREEIIEVNTKIHKLKSQGGNMILYVNKTVFYEYWKTRYVTYRDGLWISERLQDGHCDVRSPLKQPSEALPQVIMLINQTTEVFL